MIEEGAALRPLDAVPFTEYLSAFVDKSSGLSSAAFVTRVNEILQGFLDDGTLHGALARVVRRGLRHIGGRVRPRRARPGRRVRALALLGLALALLLPGCGGSDDDAGGDPSTDKLAQVLARGTLVLFTDPDYPPQSFAVEGAARAGGHEVRRRRADGRRDHRLRHRRQARRGGARGRAVLRLAALDRGHGGQLGRPLGPRVRLGRDHARPHGAAVHDASVLRDAQRLLRPRGTRPLRQPGDLDGKRIGACVSCTHGGSTSAGRSSSPGPTSSSTSRIPEIVVFEIEAPGLEATSRRARSTRSSARSRSAREVDRRTARRCDRSRPSPSPTYTSGYVDKSSGLDVGPFVERVNEIVQGLHATATLQRAVPRVLRERLRHARPPSSTSSRSTRPWPEMSAGEATTGATGLAKVRQRLPPAAEASSRGS